MKKTLNRVTKVFVAIAMVLSSFNFGLIVKANEVEKYTIYPTPQNVEYGTEQITMTNEVNVIYDNDIDSFTRKHLKDVFGLVGIKSLHETLDFDSTKTNVVVGIQGHEDVINTYFDENNLVGDFDFHHYDASILSIKGNTIAILAKDTDAAFHAITSLKHIFTQVSDKKVTELTIKDYADVKSRGFIEGYYGNPWSNDDRADLMRFGGDYKLNNYIYAPKDDPKHNRQWKSLYNEDELVEIAKLAQAGNESKCYYVYALHTFMYNAVRFDTDEHYLEDLNIIKEKFSQLMEVGVKQFAILADDAGVPGNNADNYVRLMNDLTAWMIEKAESVPGLKTDLIFCPHDYMGMGNSQEMQKLKKLPESVSVIQTGGRVWGEVGPSFNDKFYQNMERPAYMWINWPCSDNTKDGLIMGGAEKVLKPNVNPDTVNGIVLNPMQQSEPSKQGLFTNADYAWNIWESESKYESVWNDSFNYIDHGTIADTKGSSAYRELSKHMMNSSKLYNEESHALKDRLASFLKDFEAEKPIADAAADLTNEFLTLAQAAKDYREFTGNKRTLDQIIYWIDCWDDTTKAIINFLDAAVALEDGNDNARAVSSYLDGQKYLEQSRKHTFHYVDHNERAVVGRKHITPFMNKLDQLLSTKVSGIVDPTKQIVTYITNRTDTPEGNINNIFDNNPATEVIYKTPSNIEKGTYIGIKYQKAIDIDSVVVRMGQANNANDRFSKSQLEYTTDGKTWKPVSDTVYDTATIEVNDLNLKAVKGIRLVATEAVTNKWMGVKDFVVNPEATEDVVTTTVSTDKLTVKGGSIGNVTDANMNSFTHFAEGPYKPAGAAHQDYIPKDATVTLTFSKPQIVTKINVKQDNGTDKLTKYALEYTVDGTTWETFKSFNGDANVTYTVENAEAIKAVRIRNEELNLQQDGVHGYWWKLYNFSVEVKVPEVLSTEHVYTNTDAKVGSDYTNSRTELIAKEAITLAENEYVGLDLGRIKDLTSIELETSKLKDVELQVSKNAVDWVTISDLSTVSKEDARYVRLMNNGKETTITITKFVVNSNELEAPHLHSSNVGINASWGVLEDSRNNGAAFDGNIDSTTEFADFPQKGQYIIYDLGQTRNISTIELYAQDSAVNYIRDAEIQISNNLEDWTKVVTIGDGKENVNDGGITCIQSDAGYKASSRYPNKVSVKGSIAPQDARYLRILMTASNNSRAVLFNEIVINDGEYVPTINDPTFTTSSVEKQGYNAQNLFDQDLTTSYIPSSKEAGYLEYTLSDRLDTNSINIFQKAISNAKVEAYVERNDTRKWVEVGVLDQAFNEFSIHADYLLKLRISWAKDADVNISEIVLFNDSALETVNKDALQDELNKKPEFDKELYTAESFDAYTNAVKEARKVNADKKATQSMVDVTVKALREAYEGLTLKTADYTKVNDAIAKAEALNKEDYKDFSGVEAALAAVEKDLDITKQAEVDAMAEAILAAIDGLEKVEITPDPEVKPDPEKPEVKPEEKPEVDPEEPEVEIEKPETKPETDKEDGSVQTGDTTNYAFLFGTLMLAGGAMVVLLKKRKA